MNIDFKLWADRYSECNENIQRLCDLKSNTENAVKCISTLCVINHAMQDVQSYFEHNVQSSAELCFLIRNIDVTITGILDINNLLLGIGINKFEKAAERCFTDKNIICEFRKLRSLILAHPVDTHYNNDRGESETVYLEDFRPFNPRFDGLQMKEKCDYIKRMCKPESHWSYYEPLTIDSDIVPVINIISDSMNLLSTKIEQQIKVLESQLSQQNLALNHDSIQDYIISLDKELEKRYPSAVHDTELQGGKSIHYSIVYQCLMYFNAHFAERTQAKYDIFLEYLKTELHQIEADLQQMVFNEDKYFSLMYNPNFASSLSYERGKMEYLLFSDETSYTEKDIDKNTPSNALWGIRCFRILMPYINQYIPVDVSVSDKELYCQFVAAEYFSSIEKIE